MSAVNQVNFVPPPPAPLHLPLMCNTQHLFRVVKVRFKSYEFVKQYTATSRKVVGKSARANPERNCGWFSVLFFSKKFEIIGTKGHGNVFASAKGKQQK